MDEQESQRILAGRNYLTMRGGRYGFPPGSFPSLEELFEALAVFAKSNERNLLFIEAQLRDIDGESCPPALQSVLEDVYARLTYMTGSLAMITNTLLYEANFRRPKKDRW